jgi:hypothetical protein
LSNFLIPVLAIALAAVLLVYQSAVFPFLLFIAMLSTTGLIDRINDKSSGSKHHIFEIIFRTVLSIGIVFTVLDVFNLWVDGTLFVYIPLLILLAFRLVYEYVLYKSISGKHA